MKKTLTDEFLKTFCRENGYTFIRTFKNQNTTNEKKYMEIIHDHCGKQYSCRLDKFVYAGQRCTCTRKQKYSTIKSLEEYNNKLKELYGDEYVAIGKYLGSHKPVEIMHKCGHIYEIQRAEMMINQETRCPVCSKHKKRTKEETEKYCQSHGLNLKILDYTDKKNPLIQNLDCMHQYKINLNKYITHENLQLSCPICEKTGSSSYEYNIIKYIKSFYTGEIIHKYRNNNKEIDIYLPDAKLGIEIDGLYWHSEKFCNSSYHLSKTKYFLEQGIRIIHIFENEIIYKPDIVLEKIKNILHGNTERIFARKCDIVELNKDEGNRFLNINHIQGGDVRGQYFYGLKYKEELVAVMVFGNHTGHGKTNTKVNNITELTRYATKLGTNIVGGFSKLLKYFENKNLCDKILSFADLRYVSPENNVYIKNDFIVDHKTNPSYYYVCGDNLKYKYSFRKSELQKKKDFIYDDKKTEKENMLANGYHYIYDCGMIAYIKQIKK